LTCRRPAWTALKAGSLFAAVPEPRWYGAGRGLKERDKDFFMDKEYINILVFGHTTFGIRRLRIKKESFRMATYLLVFFQFSITFFFCDYVQVRKKTFLLNQLRQESQIQKSHIQLFSSKIEELDKKLSRLKDIDQKIRIMANLERGPETLPFIGMGGSSFSVTRRKSVSREKSVEEPKEQKTKVEEPKEQEPKESELTKEGDANLYPNDLPIGTTPERQ
jgi:hypothetical protein